MIRHATCTGARRFPAHPPGPCPIKPPPCPFDRLCRGRVHSSSSPTQLRRVHHAPYMPVPSPHQASCISYTWMTCPYVRMPQPYPPHVHLMPPLMAQVSPAIICSNSTPPLSCVPPAHCLCLPPCRGWHILVSILCRPPEQAACIGQCARVGGAEVSTMPLSDEHDVPEAARDGNAHLYA